MIIVTPGQMRELDRRTIEEIGIPGMVLMENAALKVVEEAEKILEEIKGKSIAVFAGKGNNGGDAFAAARHLFNKGADIFIYILAKRQDIMGDARVNLDIIAKMGIQTIEVQIESQLEDIKCKLWQTDLVIDGIFGTGFNNEVSGIAKDVIELINKTKKQVLSIDIPSGVNGETGAVSGACIRAERTVTFAYPKLGLLIHPGCEYTGQIKVADIGIPTSIAGGININTSLIDRDMVSDIIPERKETSNKGNFGRILIVSGSVGMTGAGCLSAGAALRSGAGLVYLAVPSILTNIYDAVLAEAITIPLEDAGTGILKKSCMEQLMERLEKATVAAVGPGLSVGEDIKEIVAGIIEGSSKPLVLDADALNAVSADVSVLKMLKAETVITPHPGEMSRLTGLSIEEIQKNRIKTAKEFAEAWGVITVLKGAKTIVAAPDGKVFVNSTGNAGMATGGTGDVLTGLIAGFIGQGLKPLDAAVVGVYLHGLAGDRVAKIKGEHGLIAGDLVNELPYTIKSLY